ncbi:hypothetical protein POM88_037189 [Heracleum sosnowskyi]|uniref:Aldehyde dehydrogenase domain-containing protein n=1 Tax=Heracleum sosnowskyi TaxID=360622 RepID=A0AAD8HRL4_9APIA|nr:hypothetical protein POM88_037189 [Heracleum sosnowskyi]
MINLSMKCSIKNLNDSSDFDFLPALENFTTSGHSSGGNSKLGWLDLLLEMEGGRGFHMLRVGTTLLTFPSTTGIVAEPFGVVLIIATWNFPLLVSLDPVIGAIAAGNTIVLKPLEVSPAMCALLAKYVGEYMDSSAVKVVEGAIPETSALLEQKWDKILYTGSFSISLMSVFPYEISQS